MGAECSISSDCLRGLFCDTAALGGYCAEPNADAGDLEAACVVNQDCMAGLVCSAVTQECSPGSVLLTHDLFKGVACFHEEEAQMPFGVRMKVPGLGEDHDFFSLPFPNDVYLAEGSLDLSRHPVPGPGLLGKDVLQRVVDEIEAEYSGWGVLPSIYLRFTRPVDPATLTTDGPSPAIELMDLTTGESHPIELSFEGARNKYICANHLFIRPVPSRPLREGTSYALLVNREIKSLVPEDNPPSGEPGHVVAEAMEPLDDVCP